MLSPPPARPVDGNKKQWIPTGATVRVNLVLRLFLCLDRTLGSEPSLTHCVPARFLFKLNEFKFLLTKQSWVFTQIRQELFHGHGEREALGKNATVCDLCVMIVARL